MPVKTTDSGDLLIGRARCKQWDCDFCAELNRKIWMARIGNEIESKPATWHFWTLTLRGVDHKSTERSLSKWRSVWSKFLQQCKRKFSDGDGRYIRIFEPHKSGALHVHMLASFAPPDVVLTVRDDASEYYGSKQLERILARYELGHIHDIRELVAFRDGDTNRAIVGYVGKYMTKDIQSVVRQRIRDSGMGRVRMIQTSTGWAETEHAASSREWVVGGVSESEALEKWTSRDDVIDIDKGLKITLDDFYDHPHYPNKTSDTVDKMPDDERLTKDS